MRLVRHARRALRGMTIVELAISTLLLITLSGSLTAALINVRGVFREGTIQSVMQDAGERVLQLVAQDLRRSGFVFVNGDNYPHLFDDGAATGNFAATHSHPPAAEHDLAGDPGFGVNREIVFAEPQLVTDVNGDEVPLLDANGILQWTNNEISFVLITGADGVNYVERRVNGANPRRIAGYVERMVFDDATSSVGAVPNDSVRVQLFFRRVDEKGVVHRHQAETTVALRN